MSISKHDQYYIPEDDNDCDLVSGRIIELLKTKYSPKIYSHFAEAIQEAKNSDCEAVEIILADTVINYEVLGRKLWCMAYEYMEKFAENHAYEDLSAGTLHD